MSFSKAKILQVWKKGIKIPGRSPIKWRKDKCGATMHFNQRGKCGRDKPHGWEVDHIDPNGDDEIDNLQPLHWENNVAKKNKGNDNFKCAKTT